jgi:hypothetical protein
MSNILLTITVYCLKSSITKKGNSTMKRLLIFLLVGSLIALFASPVLAGQGNPDPGVTIRIGLDRSQADPGEGVTVSGSGAIVGRNVAVMIAPQADSAAGALVTEQVVPADDGTFSAVLTVPDDAEDGIYAIRAEQRAANGAVIQYYWNIFTIGAGGSGPFLPKVGGIIAGPSLSLTMATAALGLLLVTGLVARGAYAAATGK